MMSRFEFLLLFLASSVPSCLSAEARYGIGRAASFGDLPPFTMRDNSPLDRTEVDDGLEEVEFSHTDKVAMVDCSKSCSGGLVAAVKSTFDYSDTFIKNYDSICAEYASAARCLAVRKHCPQTDVFESFTSGIRYMCVEQAGAFQATLKCTNEALPSVQTSCRFKCNADSLAQGLTMKALFEKDIKLLRVLDNHLPAISMMESCRVLKCLLTCYKAKLNIMCQGTAGSLFVEALLRPFDHIHSRTGVMFNFFELLLPKQCSFFANGDELARLKIDPELDRKLHDTYSASFDTVPPPDAVDPTLRELWKIFPNVPTVASV